VVQHALEALAPNSSSEIEFDNNVFSDRSQNYSVKFDVPRSYPWDIFDNNNVIFTSQGTVKLSLDSPERYDAVSDAYYIPDISRFTGQSGEVSVFIPTYEASGTRGLVYLKRRGATDTDEFVLRLSSNLVYLVHREFGVDGNGEEQFTETSYQFGPSQSGSNRVYSIRWDEDGVYVGINGTQYTDAALSGIDVESNLLAAYFGVDHEGNSYNPSTWNWQLRADSAFQNSPTSTTYGKHSYFTATGGVRAEGFVVLDVPMPASETLRRPYYETEGAPASIVETLEAAE